MYIMSAYDVFFLPGEKRYLNNFRLTCETVSYHDVPVMQMNFN